MTGCLRWGFGLLVAALLVGGPAGAPAEVIQQGALRVGVEGGISPRALPRSDSAPVSVAIAAHVSTTNGSEPPQLRRLQIEVNREGHFDLEGLPVCAYGAIQPASSARALAACRGALVGRGSFEADIDPSGEQPYPTHGELLVFNGRRDGHPVLFGQIYAPHPFATSFVIVFTIRAKSQGRFGTVLSASLPRALGGWGNLTGIRMTLSRRYSFHGVRRSFLSAGCPAPKGFPGAIFPLMQARFSFANGQGPHVTVTKSCRAKE
jgi:hypothetical protein